MKNIQHNRKPIRLQDTEIEDMALDILMKLSANTENDFAASMHVLACAVAMMAEMSGGHVSQEDISFLTRFWEKQISQQIQSEEDDDITRCDHCEFYGKCEHTKPVSYGREGGRLI